MSGYIEIIRDAVAASGGETPNRRARFIEHMLLAAGFRIVGKDEVDPVTLDEAADIVDTDGKINGIDRDRISDAIRAIGRKT